MLLHAEKAAFSANAYAEPITYKKWIDEIYKK